MLKKSLVIGAIVFGLAATFAPLALAATPDCATNEAKADAATDPAESQTIGAGYEILGASAPEVLTRDPSDRLAAPLGKGRINLDSDTARVRVRTSAGQEVTYVAFTLFDKSVWNCQKVGLKLAYAGISEDADPSSAYAFVRVSDGPPSKPGVRKALFLVDRATGALRSPVIAPPFLLFRLEYDRGLDSIEYIKRSASPFIGAPSEYEHALQREVLKRVRSRILSSSDEAYSARYGKPDLRKDTQKFMAAFGGLQGVHRVVNTMIVGGEMGLDTEHPEKARATRFFMPADAVAQASGLSIGPYQADIDQERWERALFLAELQSFLAERGYRVPPSASSNLLACFYDARCEGAGNETLRRGIRRYSVEELVGYQELLPLAAEFLQSPRGQAFVMAMHEVYLQGAAHCLRAAYDSLPPTLPERKFVAAMFVDGFNQHYGSIGVGKGGIFATCLSQPSVDEFLVCVQAERARRAGMRTADFSSRIAFVRRAADQYDPTAPDPDRLVGAPSESNAQVAALFAAMSAKSEDEKSCIAAAGKLRGRFDRLAPPGASEVTTSSALVTQGPG